MEEGLSRQPLERFLGKGVWVGRWPGVAGRVEELSAE